MTAKTGNFRAVRRLVLLIAALGIALSMTSGVVMAQSSGEVLDANAMQDAGGYLQWMGYNTPGQTFAAENSGALTSVWVPASRMRPTSVCPMGPGNMTISIYKVDSNSGYPSGAALASTTFDGDNQVGGPDGNGVYHFDDPATVEAGQQYAVTVNATNVSRSCAVFSWNESAADYPGGHAFVNNSRFYPQYGQGDLLFAIYVTPPSDSTPPTITVPSDITQEAKDSNGAPVSFDFSADDDVDGDLTDSTTCSSDSENSVKSGDTFKLGTTTVTCKATDKAGNEGKASFKVNVVYDWSGVLQPINGGSTETDSSDDTSIFKLGSTIPMKFKLTGDSANITDVTAKLYVSKIDNDVQGTEMEATSTAAADTGNTFRYDPTAKQYIFNLSTKGTNWTTGDYRLRIDLGDGAKHTVSISLK